MGIRKSQNLKKWFVFLLLILAPNTIWAKMTDASKQHLETLRGMEVRLSEDLAKKAALEKVRSEIHRIEKEYRLPITKFSSPNVGAARANGTSGTNENNGTATRSTHKPPPDEYFSESSNLEKKESAKQTTQKEKNAAADGTTTASEEAGSSKQTDSSFANQRAEEDAMRERARRAYQEVKEMKARRVVGYDQFGRPEYEYDCMSSFSMIL
jgi:hypothetical protein